MALRRVQMAGELEMTCLLTTITERFRRVSMHGVREELLDAQVNSVGYSVEKVRIPYPCPNAAYEEIMRNTLTHWKATGVTHAVFGDLFLQDIRRYREEKLAQLDIKPVFPLWLEDTAKLAREMIHDGFRAIVVCVDPKCLEASFVGRQFDESFLNDLPPNVDPCGENGEFHTFVYDGPNFKKPIRVLPGEHVTRDGFHFADLTLS